MPRLQMPRALCAAAIASVWTVAAVAQQTPPQPPPAEAPGKPGAEPGQQATPPPSKAPAVKPSDAPASQGLVGLSVFSSDGTKVGEVRSVDARPGGDVAALRIRTGGFLGFGGRIVAIPQGRFIRSGQSIRLDLDADQVSELPEVKE